MTEPSAPLPKIGLYLPQFQEEAKPAVDAAVEAEAAGIDGVFVFDHLWAPRNTDRRTLPIFDLLSAVGDATQSLRLGPLVAKVGIRPDTELADALKALEARVGPRLIAGLGTGDGASKAEYEFLGRAMPPMADRRERLSKLATQLRGDQVEVWLGGLSDAMQDLASRSRSYLNLWQPDADRLQEIRESGRNWTWAGEIPPDVGDAVQVLYPALLAGAEWLVAAPKSMPDGSERVRFLVGCRRELQSLVAERPLA